MLSKVEEHVDQGQAHLTRRAQGVGVVALVPDGAAATAGAVDGLGAANGEALQAAHKRLGVVGLDDQVDVVGLDREVNQAK